ncbi:MAG: hypothetical protein JW787_07580 [Sedimentisphaerales bacterium]|nr:hypothetical protein [Sedimentisphaerales bacterium]
MFKLTNRISVIVISIMSFALMFVTDIAQSQEEAALDNQPSYINELVDNSQLTQSQVNDMRNSGQSWGNIRLQSRLAEQIAANNPDLEKTDEQKYQEAFNLVSQQRAAGKGFGDIANENNLKVGDSMGNGNGTQNQQREQVNQRNQNRLENQNGSGTQSQEQIQNRKQSQTQTKTQKKSMFGRFIGIFGAGKQEKKQKAAKNQNASNNAQTQKTASATQKQNSTHKLQSQSSSNKVQTQQNVSNQVQTQNSSSSQKIRTQQQTQTNQRNQKQMGRGMSGNTSGNQNSGRSSGGRNR